jgi:hypothetical protein
MAHDDAQMPSEEEDFDITSYPDDDEDTTTDQTDNEQFVHPRSAEVPEHDYSAVEDASDKDFEPEPVERVPAQPEKPVVEQPTAASARRPDIIRPIESIKPNSFTPAIPAVTKKVVPKKHPFSWHFVIELFLVIIIAGLAITVWKLDSDKHDLTKEVASLNANPQAVVEKQTEALIAKVGALMSLPSGETPTVASVSNAAAAKQQSAFFDNAEDGDKVLLYTKAAEAILYRPSTNKIILVAPLTFNNSTAAGTTPATTTKSVPATSADR